MAVDGMSPTGDACHDAAAAAEEAAAEGAGLRLAVRCAATRWGESVALAGEGSLLRHWGSAPGGALPLSCVDGVSGASTWPLWTLEEPLLVTAGQVLEYKYVIVRGAERRSKWETRTPGENRRLIVDTTMVQAGLLDDGDFGSIASAGGVGAEKCPEGPGRQQFINEGACAAGGKENVNAGANCEKAARVETAGERAGGKDGPSELQTAALPVYKKLQRIGKGKQGRCDLVELEDGSTAVLKELKGGGRHAFRAEAEALERLGGSAAAEAGTVPRLLGALPSSRQVLMSHFRGTCAPDSPLPPALKRPPAALERALRGWLEVAGAVGEANALGLVHCDVNPWNLLLAEPPDAGVTGGPSGPTACLVDWACARAPSEAARGLPFKRRGDFQPAELLAGRVGARTDVYGCAATLLWLLVCRTRKGLPDRSPESLAAYFASEVGAEGGPSYDKAALEVLAGACCWGLEEAWEDRCPDLAPLRESVAGLLQHGRLSSAEE